MAISLKFACILCFMIYITFQIAYLSFSRDKRNVTNTHEHSGDFVDACGSSAPTDEVPVKAEAEKFDVPAEIESSSGNASPIHDDDKVELIEFSLKSGQDEPVIADDETDGSGSDAEVDIITSELPNDEYFAPVQSESNRQSLGNVSSDEPVQKSGGVADDGYIADQNIIATPSGINYEKPIFESEPSTKAAEPANFSIATETVEIAEIVRTGMEHPNSVEIIDTNNPCASFERLPIEPGRIEAGYSHGTAREDMINNVPVPLHSDFSLLFKGFKNRNMIPAKYTANIRLTYIVTAAEIEEDPAILLAAEERSANFVVLLSPSELNAAFDAGGEAKVARSLIDQCGICLSPSELSAAFDTGGEAKVVILLLEKCMLFPYLIESCI